MIKSWFLNPRHGRLRAGWRILLFLLLFSALSVGAQLGVRALRGSLPKGSSIVFVLLAVTATIAVYLARRGLDKKSFVSLGFARPRTAWKDVGFGFLLSAVMAAVVLAAMALFGFVADVRLATPDAAGWQGLLGALAVTVLVGYWEELVFRGYLLQNMAEGMGMAIAVGLSCLLYGAAHAGNPDAGVLSTLIIVLFGFLRIYGYLATGLLWLSIGMHIGWNFFQGAVLGFAASGHQESFTLVSHRASAADWLSGGDFGPEASVVTVPVVLLALLAMRAWSRRQGADYGSGDDPRPVGREP